LLYAGVPADERRTRALAELRTVGLEGREHHRPAQLSGGQQQRVAIARALVNEPRVLLADEPTGNLDTRTSAEIMAILQRLNRQGITIVMVTHEPDIARHASRIIAFRDGRIVSDRAVSMPASADELLKALPAREAA
jgi:putative ABC transport system ATP-binding protein